MTDHQSSRPCGDSFHKAAGSSFTALAGVNNEAMRTAGTVRNAPNDTHSHLELSASNRLRWPLVLSQSSRRPVWDPPRSCNPRRWTASQRSLAREIQELIAANVSFVSTEHWFPDLAVTHMPPHVTLVVIFREPVSRVLSSYAFHRCGRLHGQRCPSNSTPTCRFSEWAKAEANLYVRMLNGQPFGPTLLPHPCSMEYAQRTIGEAELDAATRALLSFRLVLTLERTVDQPRAFGCAVAQVLGWRIRELPHANSIHQRRCGGAPPVEHWDMQQVSSQNKWDTGLYERARAAEKATMQQVGCWVESKHVHVS